MRFQNLLISIREKMDMNIQMDVIQCSLALSLELRQPDEIYCSTAYYLRKMKSPRTFAKCLKDYIIVFITLIFYLYIQFVFYYFVYFCLNICFVSTSARVYPNNTHNNTHNYNYFTTVVLK